MYEHRTDTLLPTPLFVRRVIRHGGLAAAVICFSLAIGTVGFHFLIPQAWLDAFLNASMLLGGMGPVGDFPSPAGKVFASLFALYSGIVFLAAAALLLAPILHRMLHKLHLDEERSRKKR